MNFRSRLIHFLFTFLFSSSLISFGACITQFYWLHYLIQFPLFLSQEAGVLWVSYLCIYFLRMGMAMIHSEDLQVWEHPGWLGRFGSSSVAFRFHRCHPSGWLASFLPYPHVCHHADVCPILSLMGYPGHQCFTAASLLAFSHVEEMMMLSVWIPLNFPDGWSFQDTLEPMGCPSLMSLLFAFSVSALISPSLPSYTWLPSFCCLCLSSFPLCIRITWIDFPESLISFRSIGSVVNYIQCMSFLS